MTTRVVSTARIGGLTVAAILFAAALRSEAQVLPTADFGAGYLVFPKLRVSLGDPGQPQLDTLVQITNLSIGLRTVHCFYVDADTCSEVNFTLELTPGQPTAWRVSEGGGPAGIPARAPEFTGELKCVETDGNQIPVNVNDLKGEATIYTIASGVGGAVDARSYNAIGFQVPTVATAEPPAAQAKQCLNGDTPGATCTSDANCPGDGVCGAVMCLGATTGSTSCPTAEYAECPSTLILNNFFDGALDPVSGKEITTDLTLVPCSEDLTLEGPTEQPLTVVQFLVFNEFEQRMSTATRLQCFRETQLSRIDAKEGAEQASIFNVNVQGTLAGQIRARGVTTTETEVGHGVIGIAEEFHGPASVAVNLNETGTHGGKGDFVRYLPGF